MRKLLAIAVCSMVFSGVAFANDPHASSGIKDFNFKNHCVMGITMGKEVPCDPSYSEATTWTDSATGKHYCFSTPEMKNTFAKDIKQNLAKADTQWATLSTHAGHAANTGHTTTTTHQTDCLIVKKKGVHLNPFFLLPDNDYIEMGDAHANCL